MSNNNQNFLVGAILGGVIGAASVLLFTPISGAKARDKILNGFSNKTAARQHAPAKPRKVKKHKSA